MPLSRAETSSVSNLGLRMPGEWEPHQCVWVSRPHNPETWPGCLDEAISQFEYLVDILENYVPVVSLDTLGGTTDDAWLRDYGPLFVTTERSSTIQPNSGEPNLACHDYRFNGWGSKYGPHENDDRVTQRIADHLKIQCFRHSLILEGGAIDANGYGTVMISERAVLNANRNPNATRETVECELHSDLGTSQVIWMPATSIAGDDTDGHVDNVARFVNPNTIAVVCATEGHRDHDALLRNWRTLEQARDVNGARFNLVAMPSPPPTWYDYLPDRFDDGGRLPLPASYANFLITNEAVLVPTFAQHSDDIALRVLEKLFPRHRIWGIPCDQLIIGQGGIHCLTMPQPVA